jgi:hypothetical protein
LLAVFPAESDYASCTRYPAKGLPMRRLWDQIPTLDEQVLGFGGVMGTMAAVLTILWLCNLN